MAIRRAFVAGNWKMNGLNAQVIEALAVASGFVADGKKPGADVALCPPATLVATLAAKLSGTHVMVGGQDCHAAVSGANTGDVAAEMLKDAGAKLVLVGHSERRTDHGEQDKDVRAKAAAAKRAGLLAVVCIGETLGQRRAGLTLDVNGRQLVHSLPPDATAADVVIAYEPVWAIGTGLTASTADIAEVHGYLRKRLAESHGAEMAAATRIVYGGSVKPSNAKEILSVADVDGALVGGASLKAADFLGILAAYA